MKRERHLVDAFLSAFTRATAGSEMSGKLLAYELRMRGIRVRTESDLDAINASASRRRKLAKAVFVVVREAITEEEIVESLRKALEVYGLGDFGEPGKLYQRYALPGGFPLSGGALGANEGPGERWVADVKRAFGHALTSEKVESGLDFIELARRATISYEYVRALARGEHEPLLRTVVNLALALSLAPSKLVAAAETMLIGRPCPLYTPVVETSKPLPQPSESEVTTAVGMTLFAVRRWTGLAQDHFARKAGVDRTYISQIERYKHDLGLFMVFRFSGASGITAERFVQTVEAVLRAGLRKNSAEDFLLSASRLRD